MRVTHEQLAAYADGELEGAEAAEMVLAVAASPELMRLVQRHRELRERIGAEFAPILDQEVPERLAALLHPPGEPGERLRIRRPVAGDSADTPPRPVPGPAERRRIRPQAGWLLVPLLAAGLALGGFLPGIADSEGSRGHAPAPLAMRPTE